jgi:hypothetical protein
MDVLAHCRAMAAFCRQRLAFENENDASWIREAEAQSLLLLMAFCQRLGDVFMARGGVAVMAHCNFSYRFSFGFGLMATCFHGRLQRDSPRGMAISARKLA